MSEVLNINNNSELNEVTAFDVATEHGRLKYLVGSVVGSFAPSRSMSVKGTNTQITALLAALSTEKKYQRSIRRHGLDTKNVRQDERKLKRAIRNFERETGMKWPLH